MTMDKSAEAELKALGSHATQVLSKSGWVSASPNERLRLHGMEMTHRQ